jgi:hypothetical protein
MSIIASGTTSGTALVSTGNTNGNLVFQTNGTTTALTLATDQLATFAGKASFPSTIGVGGATAAASGSGVSFPATQSASSDVNTLDDYEEGTFTPTVIGTSTAGTATYTTQVGKYTKIGNVVNIIIEITYSGGTGTGQTRISGLPFAGSSTGTNPSIGMATDSIALTAGSSCASGFIINATSNVTPAQYPTGGGAQASIAYDAAGSFYVFGTYFTS